MEVKKLSLTGSTSAKARTMGPPMMEPGMSSVAECFMVMLEQPELGQEIKKQRETHGWWSAKLSGALCVSANTLDAWECGEEQPADSKVYDIARALDIPVNCFMCHVHEVQVAKVFPFHYETFPYYRKKKGIEAKELAAALGISYTRLVADWESAGGGGGTITEEQLEKLCKLLDVTWRQLAEFDPVVVEGLSSEQRFNQYVKKIERAIPLLNEAGVKRLSEYAMEMAFNEKFQRGRNGGKV